MRGDGATVGTRAGARPGDTIADVLFAFVQADLTSAIERRLQADGLLACPVQSAAKIAPALLCPTWADDAAILLADPSSHRLLERTRCTLMIAHHEMTRRAMAPNYKSGKTEGCAASQRAREKGASQGAFCAPKRQTFLRCR